MKAKKQTPDKQLRVVVKSIQNGVNLLKAIEAESKTIQND